MEPTDNQNRSKSWNNTRDLLRKLEQERRRRQAAPAERYPLWEKTPHFGKPYKTKKEDELSRHIKSVLGDESSEVLLSHESSMNPEGKMWEIPKSKSETHSHRLASWKTNLHEDVWRESSPESLGLTPNPEQGYNDSNEGVSNERSEAQVEPESNILREPGKPLLHIYVQSIEGILKEMSRPLSPLLTPLQSLPGAETCTFPLQAKAQKPIAVPLTEDIWRPEPTTSEKWHLDNLVTQRKQAAVPREGPRETGHGNGREEGEKQEQGISSKSCLQHSKAREPPYKSCGQPAKTSQKICVQMAKDCQKSSGQVAEGPKKSSGLVTKDPHKNFGQEAKDSQKSCGQVAKAPHKSQFTAAHSSLKAAVHPKEAMPRKSVGIKRLRETLVHEKSKSVQKVKSEPGPFQVTHQSCKDQMKVKAAKPKATDSKDLKPALQEPSEQRKNKGSHQANAKSFLDPKLLGDVQEGDALIPSGLRPGDLHKEKVSLAPWEKLFLPTRQPDLKRKAVRSPEESPGKKREDKGDTPRKKKK